MIEQIKNKKILIIIGIVLIIIVMVILEISNKGEEVIAEDNILLNDKKELKKEVERKEELITVDIKGSVVNPGVYSLTLNSRVIDVIRLAGGYTDVADTSLINLSKKLKDEMVVIIYSKDSVFKILEENKTKKETEKLVIKPNDINEATIDENNTNIGKALEDVIDGKININTASVEELMMLSGIGESKAEAIIEYRNSTLFKNIEDIKNVTGIGDSAFEKIKDNICV